MLQYSTVQYSRVNLSFRNRKEPTRGIHTLFFIGSLGLCSKGVLSLWAQVCWAYCLLQFHTWSSAQRASGWKLRLEKQPSQPIHSHLLTEATRTHSDAGWTGHHNSRSLCPCGREEKPTKRLTRTLLEPLLYQGFNRDSIHLRVDLLYF